MNILLNTKNIFKKIYHKTLGQYRLSALLEKELEEGTTILDVGCGRCSPLKDVRKKCYKVGLDIYEPYISKSKKLRIHDEYVVGDARTLPFPSNSFDYVIAIEVIEHLTKSDGLKMIKEMERIAKKKIILTTPNGFLPAYAGPEDNPSEKHISGWTVNEFKQLNFSVYGLNGWKYLWKLENGRSVLRFKPKLLCKLLVVFTEIFVYNYPSVAFQLLCVKKIKKNNKI